jgi:hypothetical protein
MRLGIQSQARGRFQVESASDKRDAAPWVEGIATRFPDDRTETVAQLQRSLALLRGCDAPGTRAQIEHLVASLSGRLQQMSRTRLAGERHRRPVAPPIPTADTALNLSAAECRSYAIQCESMASMAMATGQGDMLRALARLWRALASG